MWRDYTLRKQLLLTFGILTVVSLVTIEIVAISFAVGVNETVKSTSKDIVLEQITNNSELILGESSEVFRKIMIKGTQSFLLPYTFALADTYRNDYNVGPEPAYFEYGDQYLCEPLYFDDRYNKQVSPCSSYYLPGSTPSNLDSLLTTAVNDTLNNAAHVDRFLRSAYTANNDFVAGYYGLEVGNVYWTYPGTSSLGIDPDRTYDPTQRFWYTAARDSGDKTLYTAPYSDAQGKGWMISITRPVYGEAGFVGVASSDMFIKIIRDNMSRIKFLESGKAVLIDVKNDMVVSSDEWTAELDDKVGMTHSDLQDPPINDELWLELVESDSGSTEYTFESSKYLITYKAVMAHQYVILIIVPLAEATAPVIAVEDSIESTFTTLIIVLLIEFIVLLAGVVLMVLWLTNQIVKPISKMSKMSEQISNNIGGGSLTEGIDYQQDFGGIGEIRELGEDFRNAMSAIDESRRQAAASVGPIPNPQYGMTAVPWNGVAYPQAYEHFSASAPPMEAPPPYVP